MKIPTVENCCGVGNLRFAATCIGLLFACVALQQTISKTIIVAEDLNKADIKSEEIRAKYRRIIFQAGMAVVAFIMNSMLLVGIMWERPSCIFPWLVLQSVATVFCSVMFWGYTVYMVFTQIATAFLVFLGSCLFTSFHLYCIIIVYSYYKKLSGTYRRTLVPSSSA